MARVFTFTQVCGIYGKQERKGYRTQAHATFCVFKGADNKWTLGHMRSGLSVAALIPRHVQRSKLSLLIFLEAMERECPEACAMIGLIDSLPWPDELREYGTQLIEWARGV